MRILISGSSGFIGKALSTHLLRSGHEVFPLIREETLNRSYDSTARIWDPRTGRLDPIVLEDISAVIHLSGENLATRRWSPQFKRHLIESRTVTTKAIAEAINKVERKPNIFICASGAGFYGDCGDRIVDEDSPPGSGFLAELAVAWERSCDPARDAGVRVINARLGAVIGADGGMLKKILFPFSLGLGGKLGNGKQFLSWVSIDDTVRAFKFMLETESLSGPINVVSPNPVTNGDFTSALAHVLKRPAFFNVPETVLKLLLGDMAKELLLSSTRAVPRRLLEKSFSFVDSDIEPTLRKVLGKKW